MLRFKSLGSGSSGNALVVQAREGTQLTHVLIDCGLGIRELDRRLGQAGLTADRLDAIFITHEHADHIGCAGRLAQRERIPVWMSAGTHAAMGSPDWGGFERVARDGEPIAIGGLQLRPFTVPHDAREPLQLRCTDGQAHLGVLTDLGHASAHVLQALVGCHTMVLECNHDEDLLRSGPYPPFLKDRVGGYWGHLSNAAAGEIASALAAQGMRQVLAAHLSEQNNRPELAQRALAEALGCAAEDILVADAGHGSGWLTA